MKRNFNVFILMVLCLLMTSCAGLQNPTEMTPKQKSIMAYSTYNSQYASYMTDTGYIMSISGEWKKASDPVLSEDKKSILRKKKNILTRMYPLVKIFDSMTLGTMPYNAQTEKELFLLIDELAGLIE
ncbi:MAG: hypothetical protein GY853_10025 [PVC group bacterium]|nr:hypothetical protein [PVC group bacterium]